MSEIFVPGIRSRFNTEQLVEDIMRVERIPRDRVEQNVDSLQAQRAHWQELGRRLTAVRDSARFLFSHQNPFNDRFAASSDGSVISATATRQAAEQSHTFTVRQVAQADRFISPPLDERMRIEAGSYTFSVGEENINIDFRGGTLREFVDAINRRGRDRIGASLIAVQSGTRSLVLESRVTGAENRLGFHNDAAALALSIGMMEQGNDSRKTIQDGHFEVGARSSASLPIGIHLSADSPVILRLETSTRVENAGFTLVPQPPPGPTVPAGSVTFGGVTIQNAPSAVPLPAWTPPPAPQRVDNMAVLSLTFSDGSTARLPAITDSSAPTQRQFFLGEIAQGRTIVSLNIENNNTHREISIGNVEILDPTVLSGGLIPVNAISTARDAVITIEGIEITRPSNSIDDLIPGVTLNVRGVSERPVELNVGTNIEGVKDAIINFVGNYNRLMAEINVLTRRDDRIIDELTWLSREEAAEMRERLGVFSGDSSLNSLRNSLQRIVTSPFPTSMENELALLAQIGISSNAAGGTGFDQSRMRGYLEINERVLDAALENNMQAVRQLFASDTTGDMIMDTGVAFHIDALARPFVEIGGIISIRTNTIDSRIRQDTRRIETLDRQLAAREQELRIQYARMEAAFARMEQMNNSFDNFNQQNRR